jgi:hypothetical protein
MPRLYEIAPQFRRITEMLDLEHVTEDGEVVEDAELRAELDRIEATIEQKADALLRVIASEQADAEAFGAEAERMRARQQRIEKQVRRLREYLRGCLEQSGISLPLRLTAGTVTIAKPKQSVEIEEPDHLPGWAYDVTVSGEFVEAVASLVVALGPESPLDADRLDACVVTLAEQLAIAAKADRKPRRADIGKALKNGNVPGAGLVDGDPTLVIRR